MKKVIFLIVIAVLFLNEHTQAMQSDEANADEVSRAVVRKQWIKGAAQMGLGAASVAFIEWLSHNSIRHLSLGQSTTKSTLKAGALILCTDGAKNFGSGMYEEYQRYRNRPPGIHSVEYRNICNGLIDAGLAFSIYGINTCCSNYLPSAYFELYGHYQTQGIAVLLGYRAYSTLRENLPEFLSNQNWTSGFQKIYEVSCGAVSKAKSMLASTTSWLCSFWKNPEEGKKTQ